MVVLGTDIRLQS